MSGNWIVVIGSLVNTMETGGFEFIGPFENESEAIDYRDTHMPAPDPGAIAIAIELLNP